ncbi:MAG: LegC family aminotransferase [Verrucomicrobiota bacterium]|nr:LegC family aminotransferase [Verrucomicrobiota bacterium]
MSEKSKIVNLIVKAVQKVCGEGPVYLHEPSVSNLEHEFVGDCLKSTFVSSVGKYVDRFEQEISEYTGAKHAVAVVNGTSALHISLILKGVKKDDEVLVPGLTFAATANAICFANAIPHFVDSEDETFGICPKSLEVYLSEICDIKNNTCVNSLTGRRISAIIPVHIFGHPCKIEELLTVAKKFNLEVIEDAAESLGSFYKGKHTGTFGKLGTISFNGNKIITAGGGGMIITDDEDLARRAKHLSTTAKIPHRWEYVHDQVGYNYRMPNLNAALGCAQLKRLSEFLQKKRMLFQKYSGQLDSVEGIRLFSEPTNCCSNYWLQTIVLDEGNLSLRDDILAALNSSGLMSRPAWKGLHTLQHFKESPRMDMKVVNSLEKRIINIPSSSFLNNN